MSVSCVVSGTAACLLLTEIETSESSLLEYKDSCSPPQAKTSIECVVNLNIIEENCGTNK